MLGWNSKVLRLIPIQDPENWTLGTAAMSSQFFISRSEQALGASVSVTGPLSYWLRGENFSRSFARITIISLISLYRKESLTTRAQFNLYSCLNEIYDQCRDVARKKGRVTGVSHCAPTTGSASRITSILRCRTKFGSQHPLLGSSQQSETLVRRYLTSLASEHLHSCAHTHMQTYTHLHIIKNNKIFT